MSQKLTRKIHHRCPAKKCEKGIDGTCLGCNANDDGYKWEKASLRRFKSEQL